MKFCTNSNDVEEVINSLMMLEVEPFDKHVLESKEVDLVLLEHDFFYEDNEHTVQAFSVFMRRLDWGGIILERMKMSHRIFLLDRHWHQVQYNQAGRAFQFTLCPKPLLDAGHTCIVHQT